MRQPQILVPTSYDCCPGADAQSWTLDEVMPRMAEGKEAQSVNQATQIPMPPWTLCSES